jgi:hypothetical protein
VGDVHQLAKKKVDLYEQIWLRQANQPQPVQVVVNKIDKDRMHGYVSAPRYTESELTSSEAQPSTDAISKPISTRFQLHPRIPPRIHPQLPRLRRTGNNRHWNDESRNLAHRGGKLFRSLP